MNIRLIVFGIILFYVILQIMYTGFWWLIAFNVSDTVHIGNFKRGNEANNEFTLFVAGDSLAAGAGATSFDSSIIGIVTDHLAKDKYVVVSNNAVSGSRIHHLVEKDYPKNQDLSIIIVSSLDVLFTVSSSNFERDVNIVIDGYSKGSKKVIFFGPNPIYNAHLIPLIIRPYFRYKQGMYTQIIKDVSAEYDNVVHIVPKEEIIPGTDFSNFYNKDRFHPGDVGHKYWGKIIIKHI